MGEQARSLTLTLFYSLMRMSMCVYTSGSTQGEWSGMDRSICMRVLCTALREQSRYGRVSARDKLVVI